jgi:tryptophanyl-tRNA synthetase
MKSSREFWIETTDRTHLYYRVTAGSAKEARAKFENGDREYVGCNDQCNEEVQAVLEEKPAIAWT